jgi:hypothetical protein
MAVVLVATGVLATVAVAGSRQIDEFVTQEVCKRVADATVAYQLQNGTLTDDLDDLIKAGLLADAPADAQSAMITVRLLDAAAFQVLAGNQVMVTRRL